MSSFQKSADSYTGVYSTVELAGYTMAATNGFMLARGVTGLLVEKISQRSIMNIAFTPMTLATIGTEEIAMQYGSEFVRQTFFDDSYNLSKILNLDVFDLVFAYGKGSIDQRGLFDIVPSYLKNQSRPNEFNRDLIAKAMKNNDRIDLVDGVAYGMNFLAEQLITRNIDFKINDFLDVDDEE